MSLECNHPECQTGPHSYCQVEADSRSYRQHLKLIEDQGMLKDTCHVNNQVVLLFCGFELVLEPDGTYQICDTTGG